MHIDAHSHHTSLKAMLRTVWQHRHLLMQMTKRDIQSRYRGSALGVLWSFATPLLMLTVYTLVFSGVFKAKWAGGGNLHPDSTSHYALILFSGLMLHNFFSECLTRAPSIIMQHASFVTKVVFPLEILAPMLLLSACFNLMISFLVLLAAMLVLGQTPDIHMLYFPLILLPLCLMMLGGAWLLATMGVFLRDIGQMIGLVMTILLFISPIFYPADALPASMRILIYLNPLSFIVEQTRGVLLWHSAPAWKGLTYYMLAGLCCSYIGFFIFQKTRKAFADVL
jgi:lipopolysaccharide transport system permease protein